MESCENRFFAFVTTTFCLLNCLFFWQIISIVLFFNVSTAVQWSEKQRTNKIRVKKNVES